MPRLFDVCLLLLCLGLPMSAAEYYVHALLGDDATGDGSQQKPWQSIRHVNKQKFQAGDHIYFARGQRFVGGLYFDTNRGGTAQAPIIVGVYGSGTERAVIAPDHNESGIYVYNCGGLRISDLVIAGAREDLHTKPGIFLYTDVAEDDHRQPFVSIQNCEIKHCYKGISIGAWGHKGSQLFYCGFDGVSIDGVLVHHCRHEGIDSWGISQKAAPNYSHRSIHVRNCEVHHVAGDPQKKDSHSGSGIVLSGVDGAVIEGCYAHHNGGSGGRSHGGGPVGIWVWNAKSVIMRNCLVHDQLTNPGAKDGGGFDLDGGAVDCIIEYCWSYNNHGPGYLIAEYVGAAPLRNNIIRFNVSVNDGQTNKMGAFHIWNGKEDSRLCENILVHNNLLMLGPASTGSVIEYQSGGVAGFVFRQNVLLSFAEQPLVRINNYNDVFSFEHNLWYASGGGPKFLWAGKTLRDEQFWRTVEPTARYQDPQLPSATDMPRPKSIAAMQEAFRSMALKPGNPCYQAGIKGTHIGAFVGIND